MPKPTVIGIAWLAIFLLAAWLRLSDLGERPMHADEATGARLLADRLEGGNYRFDPKHFHGPLLTTLADSLARLRGEHRWRTLTPATLRTGTAIAGLLLVLTPLLWLRPLGATGSLAAGAFLATSPLLVYYSRMFIHESWLALFGMLALNALYRVLTQPVFGNACFAGVAVGLMYATKETVAISILAWAAAGAVLLAIRLTTETDEGVDFSGARYSQAGLFCAVAALITSAFFYTDGFRDWQGMVDAVRTFFIYETGEGQDKPLWYFARLLILPKDELGIWWTEVACAVFAVIGIVTALRRQAAMAAVVFLAVSILAHLGIYSLIAYKTPWLMVLPWAQVCLLAGFAFRLRSLPRHRFGKGILLFLGAASLFHQTHQSRFASGRYANDARNPYAYVPTTRDPEKIATWLQRIEALPSAPSLAPIGVTGREYWPLPWYLRSFESVGYWPEPEPRFVAFPVVLAMPAQREACSRLLGDTHIALPRSLRHNVPLTLYLRHDLWEEWKAP